MKKSVDLEKASDSKPESWRTLKHCVRWSLIREVTSSSSSWSHSNRLRKKSAERLLLQQLSKRKWEFRWMEDSSNFSHWLILKVNLASQISRSSKTLQWLRLKNRVSPSRLSSLILIGKIVREYLDLCSQRWTQDSPLPTGDRLREVLWALEEQHQAVVSLQLGEAEDWISHLERMERVRKMKRKTVTTKRLMKTMKEKMKMNIIVNLDGNDKYYR